MYDLMGEVVNKLNQSGRLLIIDEAENLPYRAFGNYSKNSRQDWCRCSSCG
ncbi:MAG: hypothetical protein L6V95_15565 [Candidatus Melainabacteria bacterium]|nr:MAG: hypothetical protein L6V95_15565 [Candidatus Melainabacteria bacterium]